MVKNPRPGTNNGKKTLFIFLLIGAVTLSLLFMLRSLQSTGFSSALVPDAEESEKIFAVLHKNVYDTFNEKNEVLAYDRLENSVESPFLDQVYKEIYHYFEGRKKGGPSIEIIDVKLRSFEKLNSNSREAGSVTFKVKATWDVLSIVTHYKHWHTRTNNFKGVYTLGLIEGEWKIIQDEILWQRRIPLDLASFKS